MNPFIVSGLFFLFILHMNCHQNNKQSNITYSQYIANYDSLKSSPAVDLLKKAIEYSGGWTHYTELEGIEYMKIIYFTDSTGVKKDSAVQKHRYNVFPEFKVRIEWKDKNDSFLIMNNGQQSWKFKNEELQKDQNEINAAYNSSYGSQYVFFMPWKLADPHVELTYTGPTSLPNGKSGDGIQISYSKSNSTTLDHTWWYYFDKNTGRLIGNFLKYPGGYSYTEYLEFQEVDGLLFNKKRISYQSDSTMSSITPSTIYENSEINLVAYLPNDIFEP